MLGQNKAQTLRPRQTRTQSGFTLFEIVITLIILGMIGLMVNGVVIRLAQTHMASANVAERLPVVSAAINIAREEMRDATRTPSLKSKGGALILDNSIALLPSDWVESDYKVELKTATPSVTIGEATLASLIRSFGDEGQGYGSAPTKPTATELKAATWYDVTLDVILDPSSGIKKELTFSVEK